MRVFRFHCNQICARGACLLGILWGVIACEKNTSPVAIGKLIGAIFDSFALDSAPGQIDFRTVTVGQPNPSQPITLTSKADEGLYISEIYLDDTVSFLMDSDNNEPDFCRVGAKLENGVSCRIGARFLPSHPGNFTSTVTVWYGQSSGGRDQSLRIDLLGKAVKGPTGDLTISPLVKNYGAKVEGIQTGVETFTVENLGSRDLYITDLGTNSDAFIISSSTCPAVGATLAKNTACTVTVTYEPYPNSNNDGQLNIYLGNKPGQKTFNLEAILSGGMLKQSMVGQSAISSAPSSLDFGTYTLFTPSSPERLEITNTSIIPTYFMRIATTNNEYSIGTNTCPISPRPLMPGETCEIAVSFSPAAEGSRVANVSLAWGLQPGDRQFIYAIELAGTGIRPVLAFGGLTSIDNVTGLSMRLNWTNIPEAASYQVYSINNQGAATFVKAVAAPAASSTITGLSPASTYKFRVRAFSASGDSDHNTSDIVRQTLLYPPPSITSVSPNTGIATGGTTISINGTGFSAGSATVLIGSVACSNITIATPSLITCVTQAQAAGSYPVTVINTDNQTNTLDDAFTYALPFDGLQSITGTTGTSMTLNWGVSSAAAIYKIYQIVNGTSTYHSAVIAPNVLSTITGLTPNTSYTWRVRAFDSNNGSDANTNDLSASTLSNPPPIVTSVSPHTSTLSGGVMITINGTNFIAGATVTVGGSACATVNVVSATSITCILPAHSAGIKDLVVTHSDSQNAAFPSAVSYVVTFAGLQTVSDITGIGMTLNWAASPDAASYHIYRMVSGSSVFIASVPSSALSYVATGLSPNTSYTWRVRAFDITGAQDQNTADVAQSTLQHAPPTILTVNPSSLSKSLGGSQTVSLTGTDFRAGASVSIGGSACSSITILTGTSLTCVPAALATGSYTASITNTDNQSGSLANAFRYFVSFSGISSINQVQGNAMTLNWASSPDASSYYIYRIVNGSPNFVASVASNLTSYTATGLTPGQSYTWRVRAIDNAGAQDKNSVDSTRATLDYLPPTISSVSPSAGALAGGGTLTLTGTDFRSGATITVGGIGCTSPLVSSSTLATCTLPAKGAGDYAVVITNSDGQLSTSAYRYQPAPTVTGVSPGTGSYLGGSVIGISGTGFMSGATVTVNGVTCTLPIVTSSTSMTCVTPGFGSGTIRSFVKVRVTNSDTQYGELSDAFMYTVDNLTLLAGQPITNGCTDGDGVPGDVRFSDGLNGLYNDGIDLYMADTSGYTIRKMNLATGVVSLVAGKRCIQGSTNGIFGTATLRSPYGLVKLGNALYFADRDLHVIRKVDLTAGSYGTVSIAAGSSAGNVNDVGTAAKFNYPRSITTDGNYLYVSDTNNHSIRRIDPSESFTVTTIAGSTIGSADGVGTSAQLNSPRGLQYYVDPGTGTAYLLVVTGGDHRLRAIRLSDQNVTTLAGSSAGYLDSNGTAAKFYTPNDITISGTYAYITDLSTHTIRRVDLNGFSTFTVTTVAGANGITNWHDGRLSVNRLASPLVLSASGSDLYFSDDSATLRKVDLSSESLTVSTVLGYNPQNKNGQLLVGHNQTARFNIPVSAEVASDGTSIYFTLYSSGHCVLKLDPTVAYEPKSVTIPIQSPATLTSVNHGYADGMIVTFATTEKLPTGFAVGSQYFVKNATADTFQLAITPGGTSINATVSQSGIHSVYRPNTTIISGLCTAAAGTDGASQATARHNHPAGLVYSPDLNSLIVSDANGQNIRRVDLTTGQTTTIAGQYNTSGATDHPIGINARFTSPVSLAIDTSVTPNVVYVGEGTSGSHIRKIDLIGDFPVTTVVGKAGTAGTNANLDGYGNSAQTSGVTKMAVGSYANSGGATERKLFFSPSSGASLRSYDLNTTYVQTLTSTTAGFQDTEIPAAGLDDTQNAKFDVIRGIYWTGNQLLISDYNNHVIRWFEPRTGTVGTLMEGYAALSKSYTASTNIYFESINSTTISGGTASVSLPAGVTYVPNLGYILFNTSGIWILN